MNVSSIFFPQAAPGASKKLGRLRAKVSKVSVQPQGFTDHFFPVSIWPQDAPGVTRGPSLADV